MDLEDIQIQRSVYIYTLYPPVALAVLLLLFFYFILALYLVSNKHVERSTVRVPGIANCLVKITFRGSLSIKQVAGVPKELRLFGYRVPAGLINSLGLTAMIVWVGVVSAFWIVLIGKEKATEYPDFEDCMNESYNMSCDPIVYNKVSLDYVKALGAAGGLLVLTTVIIHGQTIIMMWMMKKSRTANSKVRKAWKFMVVALTIAPLLIEMVTFLSAAVFVIYLSLYTNIQNWIQFGSFVIAVFQSTYFPCLILYHTWRRRTRYPRDTDIEQGVRLSDIRNSLSKNENDARNGESRSNGLNRPLLQDSCE